ncbi:MAG: VWA domain-containing protein [Gammaproteobacteria bacterium]
MTIRFIYPFFLLLLLAAPLPWLYPRRLEDRIHGILRTLLLAGVIFALARPVLLVQGSAGYQVLIVDESAGLTAQQRERSAQLADRWVAQLEDREKAAVVVLDQGAEGAARQPESKRYTGIDAIVHVSGTRSASSLSAALAAAERQIPQGSSGAITLISDGLSTDRRWGPTVQSLIRRGVAVNTADLGRDDTDVYPAALVTDATLRAGQTTRVTVHVAGRARAMQVRLLDARGAQLAISPAVDSDGRVSVPLDFEPPAAGFMTIRAQVLPVAGDTNLANDSLEKTLAIQPPLRLLYLGERMQGGERRLSQLLGKGFSIEDGSRRDLAQKTDLREYDLVMIDDRTAAHMPQPFQEQLSAAVRNEGLGLIFAGGKAAFGAGGYDATTLAGILPVDISQYTEKRDPSAALAIVIDTSGSMSGSRMELARQVARLAGRRLKAHDRIGIVEFYGNKQWALPMQSAANKISIDRAVGRMQPGGGTVLLPAIEEAFYGLKDIKTRYRHILIITDGGIESADFESLIQRIALEHINVSTVLVGPQAHDQALMDMAAWGRGRFYAASDRYSLPEVLLKQPSTLKLPSYKTGSFDVAARGAEGWWGGVDRGKVPQLSGYVETRARPGAEVVLEVSGSEHPVLASWHYGLGRVTALMTEPVGEGTASWSAWRDYGRWLARVAERTANDSSQFRFDIERNDRRVTLTARRYGKIADSVPRAFALDSAGGHGAEIGFRQLAPDYFIAELSIDPDLQFRASATAIDSANSVLQPETLLVSAAAEDIAPEQQVDPAASLDLQALAEVTSGIAIDPARPLDARFAAASGASRGALTPFNLWWYALLLALLLYLVELVYRRWPGSRS